jgi:polysaccharide deacetylase 2 family uncharacterized protein YibQ
MLRRPTVEPTEPAPKGLTSKLPEPIIPTYEIFPEEKIPYVPPLTKLPETRELPKVAIIIDDLGYDKKMAQKFLELDVVLTFSVLPHSPYTKHIVRAARSKGLDVMLHLPMEPNEYPGFNPGPGALLMSMSPDELINQLKKNIDDIPDVRGVNNHMGSKMTTDADRIYQIFTVLKQRGLFFIDSRSTDQTLCKPSARLFQIPFGERDVFIDHIQKPEFIRKQLQHLIHIARGRGEAIGIAHPSKTTLKILREELPYLQENVELVPVSQMVHILS